jgi:hypothetical protein
MRKLLGVIVVLQLACLHPQRGFVVVGGTPDQVAAAGKMLVVAKAVTGDTSGALSGDLGVRFSPTQYDLIQFCLYDFNTVAGCTYRSGDGFAVIVEIHPDQLVTDTALAHELCHVGYVTTNEDQVKACAAEVIAEYEATYVTP